MSCEETRRVLPLLDHHDADEEARIRAHLAVCHECHELAAGFEADAKALTAYRAGQSAVPRLDGFTDAVMARIADEPREETRAPAGTLIRASFGPTLFMAAAAGLMLAIGLGIAASLQPAAPDTSAPVVAKDDAATTTPERVAPVKTELLIATPLDEALPSPRRSARPRRALDLRTPRSVVPVGSNGSRNGMRGAAPLLNMFRGIWGRGEVIPPLQKGEREVSF